MRSRVFIPWCLALVLSGCIFQSSPNTTTATTTPPDVVTTVAANGRQVEIVDCGDAPSDAEILCEGYTLIKDRYVDRVADEALAQGASEGLDLLDGAQSDGPITCAVPNEAFTEACLDAAEQDVPKKTEADKKANEALAAANKDVMEKTAAVEKTKTEKIAAEKVAIEASTAARNAQLAQANAETMAKDAAALVPIAQQKATLLAQMSNASRLPQARYTRSSACGLCRQCGGEGALKPRKSPGPISCLPSPISAIPHPDSTYTHSSS